MDTAGDVNRNEYVVTALQIFEYCGAEASSTLRVDVLMEKFAPFVKTNKSEYSYLKSLLDPGQDNPELTVSKLADALNKYSESQKVKVEQEESFNLKCGPVPHDSDSGISTDGFQLLEELQCELREKSHLAHQLRSQLDFTDKQNEEAVAALTAERDSLRSHLNMLREENMTLVHVRRDYDDVCERLSSSECALGEARRDLEGNRKRNRVLNEQVTLLETEKLTLQDLLAKSKQECHRINEMYASRQAALLGENETFRTKNAELTARLQDHDEFMQQVMREKIMLEMELKDMLNKSNHTPPRLDRSIDVSYTDDQMLTALESLNSDSRFNTENRILDEEAFVNALREEQGRQTNISLFDEIRLSFCNMSRHSINELNEKLDNSPDNKANQSHKLELFNDVNKVEISKVDAETQTDTTVDDNTVHETKSTQTNCVQKLPLLQRNMTRLARSKLMKNKRNMVHSSVQTENSDLNENNNNVEICNECTKCFECGKLNDYAAKLKSDLDTSQSTISNMQLELERYEASLNVLNKFVDEGNERNEHLKLVVGGLKLKLAVLEEACELQGDKINSLCCDTCCAEVQTVCEQISVSSQTDFNCAVCVKRDVPRRRLRRYLWEPLKCLFQVFAVICFVAAISVLYSVTRRWHSRCAPVVPWNWMQPHDLIDLLFHIEYLAEVPM